MELVEFCKATKWRGEPLSNDPLIRSRLTQLSIEIDAGLAQARHIFWGQHKIFAGEEGPAEQTIRSSSGKYYASELAQRFAYVGCQVLGLYSQLKGESRWAPFKGWFEGEYQRSPGTNIAGGTTEIQKNIIAWGMGLPRT